MDNIREQLVDYIARFLKQDFSQEAIRKAVRHNNWDEAFFEDAFQTAKDRLEQATQTKDSHKAAKTKKAHKRDDGKDAASLQQDEAVMLHQSQPEESIPDLLADVQDGRQLVGAETAAEQQSHLDQQIKDALGDNQFGSRPAGWQPSPHASVAFSPFSYTYPPGAGWPPANGPYPPQQAAAGQYPPQSWTGQAGAYPAGQIAPASNWNVGSQPAGTLNGAYLAPAGYRQAPPNTDEQHQTTGPPAELSPPSELYGLRTALKDTYRTIKVNLVTFLMMTGMASVLSGAAFYLALLATSQVFTLRYNFLLTTPPKIAFAAFGSMAVYAIWYIVGGSLTATANSLVLYESTGKRRSSINTILAHTASRLGRAAGTFAALTVITFIPAGLIVILPTLLLISGKSADVLATALPFLYLASAGWLIGTLMRYGLAPYVALFEHNLHGWKIFKRSRQLLAGNGGWFVAKVVSCLIIAALGLALLTGKDWRQVAATDNIFIDVAFGVLLLIANGLLVMFYRNRRLLKG